MKISDLFFISWNAFFVGILVIAMILYLPPYESTVVSSKAAIEEVNKLREEKLQFSMKLYEIARIRVYDMLEEGYCSHFDPNGENDIYGLYPKYGVFGGGEALVCAAVNIKESEAIQTFLESEAHRWVVLESGHYGAIYCKQGICVFLTGYGA